MARRRARADLPPGRGAPRRRRADGPDAGRPGPGQAGRWRRPARPTPAVPVMTRGGRAGPTGARPPRRWARRSPTWSGRATSCCSPGDLGAGKTAFTQGFGPRPRRRPSRSPAPPSRSPTSTPGRLTLHHLDVYRLEHLNEVLDVGLAEMLDEGAVVVIEWGDAIVPGAAARLPRGPPHLRRRRRRPRAPRSGPSASRWAARADAAAWPSVMAPWGGTVLILGIETATVQVGCAIGGHEGVLASTPLGPGQAPRRVARAGHRLHLPAGPRRR